MKYLPICAHKVTTPARVIGKQRRSKCVACGLEFALITVTDARDMGLPVHQTKGDLRREAEQVERLAKARSMLFGSAVEVDPGF